MMNRFLKASLLSACLTTVACAETTDKTKDTTTVVSSAKTTETKQVAREARKLERAKKLIESCTADYNELESKVASADEVQKKKITLALAHAKLDLDAAKDSEVAGSIMWLTRQCKRHLMRVKDLLEGKERATHSRKKDQTDTKSEDTTPEKA